MPHQTSPFKWLLRECVRANPLYVISALLLAAGVRELAQAVDPEIGKLRGNLLALLFLHIYEVAVLVVATVILTKRRVGRDCHGLMIVAGLFLAGSFLAFDELISMEAQWGSILLFVALALAWAKINWYARLPGIHLPMNQRYAVFAILAAHAVSPVLAAAELHHWPKTETMQQTAWLLGWLSLIPVFLLVRAGWKRREKRDGPGEQNKDVLATNTCGTWAIAIMILIGITHLYACDWVFDKTPNFWLAFPAATILLAIHLLNRTIKGLPGDLFIDLLCFAPAVALQLKWLELSPWSAETVVQGLLSPSSQLLAATALFYLGLGWGARNPLFYWGLASPVLAPTWTGLTRLRIPNLRAFVLSGAGLLSLIAGMLVSLYRDRMLKWLDSESEDQGTSAAQ